MPSTKTKKSKKINLPITEWIDISVPLTHGMVRWPTDPKVEIKRIHDMKMGDHAGTHVDAPSHLESLLKKSL